MLHHGLGLAVILLWIYINLVFLGRLKARISIQRAMQATAGIWVVSFILGLHIYLGCTTDLRICSITLPTRSRDA